MEFSPSATDHLGGLNPARFELFLNVFVRRPTTRRRRRRRAV